MTDHPRAGGEHRRASNQFVQPAGSSPRRRGTRRGRRRANQRLRIIPAQAGNTRFVSRSGSNRSDHPRAGGEHRWRTSSRPFAAGSSPRRRGTRCGRIGRRFPGRIIPAQAGNTPSKSSRWRAHPDHPRAGGEHETEPLDGVLYYGSSPRRRGTPPNGFVYPSHFRIIPAQAGNTPSGPPGGPTRTDHPRAGGEHISTQGRYFPVGGSSPRRRGTPIGDLAQAFQARIIPAQAGNTSARRGPHRESPDHPRAGGEHSIVASNNSGVDGSSPRRRGTRAKGDMEVGEYRIIPAQAGNTFGRTPR